MDLTVSVECSLADKQTCAMMNSNCISSTKINMLHNFPCGFIKRAKKISIPYTKNLSQLLHF